MCVKTYIYLSNTESTQLNLKKYNAENHANFHRFSFINCKAACVRGTVSNRDAFEEIPYMYCCFLKLVYNFYWSTGIMAGMNNLFVFLLLLLVHWKWLVWGFLLWSQTTCVCLLSAGKKLINKETCLLLEWHHPVKMKMSNRHTELGSFCRIPVCRIFQTSHRWSSL